ncbi:uncharacterized protein ARMOST_18602 [Armillaria ostoyae]|uniref:Uncharacterized protein n=1 Tax=Armillaria ostoyae TaxID=47428 RepID=A0A284S276_ARMOS|nr:uncharacterized protein ARMOST_18602 [Armillaria ostoyae]
MSYYPPQGAPGQGGYYPQPPPQAYGGGPGYMPQQQPQTIIVTNLKNFQSVNEMTPSWYTDKYTPMTRRDPTEVPVEIYKDARYRRLMCCP